MKKRELLRSVARQIAEEDGRLIGWSVKVTYEPPTHRLEYGDFEFEFLGPRAGSGMDGAEDAPHTFFDEDYTGFFYATARGLAKAYGYGDDDEPFTNIFLEELAAAYTDQDKHWSEYYAKNPHNRSRAGRQEARDE